MCACSTYTLKTHPTQVRVVRCPPFVTASTEAAGLSVVQTSRLVPSLCVCVCDGGLCSPPLRAALCSQLILPASFRVVVTFGLKLNCGISVPATTTTTTTTVCASAVSPQRERERPRHATITLHFVSIALRSQDLRLKGVGGRVALVLRLGIGGGIGAEGAQRREVVVANTHLLFPHAR